MTVCSHSRIKCEDRNPEKKCEKGSNEVVWKKHKNGWFEHYLDTFVETFEQRVGTQEVCFQLSVKLRFPVAESWIYQMAVNGGVGWTVA